MNELVLARRYASALLKLSEEARATEKVRSSLHEISALVAGSKPLFKVITDEKVPSGKKYDIIREIGVLISMHELVLKFVGLLIQKGRIRYLKEISDSFSLLADEALGVKRGEISIVDGQIGEKLRPGIEKGLSEKMSKKVDIKVKEDPSILGGILLKVENTIYDASVKRSLQELKERLCQ